MRRRVQSFDRAVVGCVVQIRLDGDLLSSLVSSVAATMSAVEVVKNGVPCLGVAFLICQRANGSRNHAVDYRLVVINIGPPRACPIPGHSRWIMCPSDTAWNNTSPNSQGRKRLKQGRHAGSWQLRASKRIADESFPLIFSSTQKFHYSDPVPPNHTRHIFQSLRSLNLTCINHSMTAKTIAVETPNRSIPFDVSSGPNSLQEGDIMRSP